MTPVVAVQNSSISSPLASIALLNTCKERRHNRPHSIPTKPPPLAIMLYSYKSLNASNLRKQKCAEMRGKNRRERERHTHTHTHSDEHSDKQSETGSEPKKNDYKIEVIVGELTIDLETSQGQQHAQCHCSCDAGHCS
jgi:hypothetical protein